MKKTISLSVFLPAFNEEAVIADNVREIADVLRKVTWNFEVIVCDDGSRDRTGPILSELQCRQPELNLKIVTHEVNQGYGAALASGFNAAVHELVFFTDGDKQFDVRELNKLLDAFNANTDLVIGWRKNRADPPLRRLNAWGWKLLISGV